MGRHGLGLREQARLLQRGDRPRRPVQRAGLCRRRRRSKTIRRCFPTRDVQRRVDAGPGRRRPPLPLLWGGLGLVSVARAASRHRGTTIPVVSRRAMARRTLAVLAACIALVACSTETTRQGAGREAVGLSRRLLAFAAGWTRPGAARV